MRPSTRARYSTENGSSTIAASSSRSGGGDDDDSCGISRPKAATSSSVTVGRDLDLGTHVGRRYPVATPDPTVAHGPRRVPRMTVATHPARRLGAVLEPVAARCTSRPSATRATPRSASTTAPREVNGVAMPDGPAYFTSRGSILGQVPGEVVAAAFGVFNPEVVVPVRRARLVAHRRAPRSARPAPTAPSTSCAGCSATSRTGSTGSTSCSPAPSSRCVPRAGRCTPACAPLGIPDDPLGGDVAARRHAARVPRRQPHRGVGVGRARRHRDRSAHRAVLGAAAALVQPHAGVDRPSSSTPPPNGWSPAV